MLALAVAVALIGMIGRLTRHYVGKRLIALLDETILHVPLLNKIYGTVKQVNAAFSTGSRSAFKQVVLVEFPRPGLHSIGFVTADDHPEVARKIGTRMVSVFVPTTPNPTSGFLVILPVDQVRKLDMSVADGIKFIISLGAIVPGHDAGLSCAARAPAAPPPTAP
jgi:uncharacterized membrane protein